ncbi:MAG: hypothetical protein U0Q18_21700 [Bryobacteraceae bacterium]
MSLGLSDHVTEDALEEYSMCRLLSTEAAEIEEHLLVCPRCLDDWQASERTIGLIRHAALAFEAEQVAKPRRRFGRFWLLPQPACALAAAALCLVLAVAVGRHGNAPPTVASVVLQSARGAEAASDPEVRAGSPFLLSLDLTGLQPAEQYGVEIVNGNGEATFHASAAPRHGRVTLTVEQGLRPGSYFVRLFTLEQDLLREYHLIAAL